MWGGLLDSVGLFVFTGDRLKVVQMVLGGADGAPWRRWCPNWGLSCLLDSDGYF